MRASEPKPIEIGSTYNTAVRLIRFAFAVDRRAFSLTVAISFLGSVAEGASLVLLLPLLSAAGMNFAGATIPGRLGLATQNLLLRVGIPHPFWLPVVLAVFLIAGAARSVLRRTQYMMSYTTTTSARLALSNRLYEAIVKAQWSFLVRQRSGRFTHLLTQELRHVTDSITLSLSLINLIGLILLYLALALRVSVSMTLLVLGLGGLLMFFQRASLSRARQSGKAVAESVGEIYAATAEHLLNLKSVKTYDAEDRDVQMLAGLSREVARNSVRSARHLAAASLSFEVGSLLALGTVIFLALAVVHVQSATMLLLLAIFTRLMPQLASLQSQTHQYANILPSFENVLRVEADCLAHAEPKSFPSNHEQSCGCLTFSKEFTLDNLWFAYQPAEGTLDGEFVLQGLSLAIKAGILTAVTGPSGAGKSTIADLVNGLLQPTRGRILLDGRELSPAELRQWRRQVGYVGQETVLFHQSVRKNLLWARPEANEADLTHALDLASANFVYDLPGGLESIVGDRGILLSSGQRQRIALARALLRQPTLLILDEATNALDIDNETRILDAIRKAMQEASQTLTVLMIAHRPSAIRRADRIFELESGRIARFGTWSELNPAGAP